MDEVILPIFMIAGVIGYDSIRTHLAVWTVRGITEKDHSYGCVHRKLEDMPDEGRRSK